MYDYVRRQQELQPGMFLSRTFHWMEHGSRERQPSWTRMYSRNGSHDPLAFSSSSLFAGPRATPKPASTLGSVLQRSAASLSPHRALLTFRRHRQHSDAATRPPSGFSGTFVPRRRGFTAPSGLQPPVFATPALPNRSAHLNPNCEPSRALGTGKHEETFQPITESATELCPSMQAKSEETGTRKGAKAAIGSQVPVYAAADNDASIMPSSPLFCLRDDEQNADKANDLSSFADQPSSSSPQPFSSFSPPLSPSPRTICHRARSLMHRQLSPHGFANGVCQPGQRRLPRSPLANPLVLENDSESDLEKFVKEQPPQPTTNGAVHMTASKSNAAVPSVSVGTSDGKDEDEDEDEDTVKCLSCMQYKGHEWIVSCEHDHQLCFGCVQLRVRDILAAGPASTVSCPISKCAAIVASRHLRACLPPQRLQQLSASSKRADRAVQLVCRSLGLHGPSYSSKSTNRHSSVRMPGLANQNDDGFDAPLMPEDDINSRPVSRVVGGTAAEQVLSHSVANLAVADKQSRRSYLQRFAVSMPVLAETSGSGSASASASSNDTASDASTTPPLLSELTHVGHASVDSVVMAATVAADSTVSLSPESVGSRLRRVPKAQENLTLSNSKVDYSSGSQTADNEQDSPQASSAFYINTPPPVPPSLPLPFRASATWITPEQRYSGYTENMLLNATLFETIRRKPSPSNDEDSEYSFSEGLFSPPLPTAQRLPVPQMASVTAKVPSLSTNKSSIQTGAREDEENAHGVYIPTWRRPEAADPGRQMPLWAGAEYGSQSGVLCEAAELNFDLYETLHKRR
ncbi:hypothetical protein LPJ64_001373 [Coemansia asiatica]|uniref:Uncharacterized protein n=1 Tax=Coemansia asiatica TaxID=1052880 RepID=A0A9W7XQ24_9FUNG|nr:hypothetical protein LPJ64_001373 [Coemansia asiatica]